MVLCNSILLYDITCWGGTNKTDINTLHTLPKKLKSQFYRYNRQKKITNSFNLNI